MIIMRIAQTETQPIDENIFLELSGLPKKVCFATNKKNFYKYRQQTSLIYNSQLSPLRYGKYLPTTLIAPKISEIDHIYLPTPPLGVVRR